MSKILSHYERRVLAFGRVLEDDVKLSEVELRGALIGALIQLYGHNDEAIINYMSQLMKKRESLMPTPYGEARRDGTTSRHNPGE